MDAPSANPQRAWSCVCGSRWARQNGHTCVSPISGGGNLKAQARRKQISQRRIVTPCMIGVDENGPFIDASLHDSS